MYEERKGNIRVLFNNENQTPLLFEMKKAYNVLGVDIDSLLKDDIIDIVEKYLLTWHSKKLV